MDVLQVTQRYRSSEDITLQLMTLISILCRNETDVTVEQLCNTVALKFFLVAF